MFKLSSESLWCSYYCVRRRGTFEVVCANLPCLQPRFDQVKRVSDNDACCAGYVPSPEICRHFLDESGIMSVVEGHIFHVVELTLRVVGQIFVASIRGSAVTMPLVPGGLRLGVAHERNGDISLYLVINVAIICLHVVVVGGT